MTTFTICKNGEMTDVQISSERLERARNYATRYERAMLKESYIDGSLPPHMVGDKLKEYRQYLNAEIDKTMSGAYDDNFSVWQGMNKYFTGENVALFKQ